MKKRAKVDHWVSDIFGNPPHLEERARISDRKLDNRVGAQVKGCRNHRPAQECDWRRLEKFHTHNSKPEA